MSFKDTFTRDSSGRQNLQYDDIAFHHFFMTILIVVALPLTYSILKNILNPFSKVPRLKEIESNKQFKDKVQRFKKENKFSYMNCGFLLKILLLIALIYGIGFSFMEIQASSQEFKGFDPYEILGVSESSTVQEIKKAYRKLALKYHPDRNRDDPEASAKFMMISKAYQCLTDEEAKEKCAKYGNPEGANAFNVGIALPSFLIKKQNHVMIMGIVFVLVVIILPIFLIQYHSQINKYDDYGMLYDSHPFIHGFLNQHYAIKDCVKTLAMCAQFKELRTTRQQLPHLENLLKNSQEDIQKTLKKKNFFPYIKKAMLLIGARATQTPIASEFDEDMRLILRKLPLLIKATIMIGLSRSTEYFEMQYRGDKFVGFNALHSLILFGQYFIQGKSFEYSDSFEQIDLNRDEVEKIRKKKKNKKINDLKSIIGDTKEREAFLSLIDQRRLQYVKQCIDFFPQTTILARIQTENESQIAAFDAFKVLLKVQSNRKSTFCCANNYPFLKMEGWYILVAKGNTVVFMEHFNFESLEQEFKFDLRHDKQGSHALTVHLISDCYFGLQVEETLKYEVKHARKFTEEDEAQHREGEEEEGSMFSKMLSSLVPSQEEEVSDEEGNEEAEATEGTSSLKQEKQQDRADSSTS